MPNRVLRASICTSETINELSPFEEVLFYRLIVQCDDYGVFDARPKIIKGVCFPLKDNITYKNIENGLSKLSSVGLIDLYNYQGKPFLQLVTWGQYQSIRAKRSKYPQKDANCNNVNTSAINCKQLQADVPVIRIQSESLSESESESVKTCARHKHGAYKNVLLTDEELDKLKTEFANWADRIERLSEYMASTGKKYKSHYATIRAWARREGQANTKNKEANGNPFMRYALEADDG